MNEPNRAIWVEIIKTRGSAPRDAGAAIKVLRDSTEGTIGGGALELRAIDTARQALLGGRKEFTETIPLGPNLGQCCGGSVSLRYTYQKCSIDAAHISIPSQNPQSIEPKCLWVWGAGHVGRAVIQACEPEHFEITWVDSGRDRFPASIPKHITAMPTAQMPLLAARAPKHAHHLIFTYSHDIDLALCAALLRRGAASIGLIGSKTKWARFSKRLRNMDLNPSLITCPIGEKSLGKTPHAIAHGTVQHLLTAPQSKVLA